MTSEWIERRKAEMEADEQRSGDAKQLQLLRAGILKAKGPDYATRLVEYIHQQINTANEKLGGKNGFVLEDFNQLPLGCQFHKAPFPTANVTCEVDIPAQVVRLKIARITSQHSSTHREERLFHLRINEQDEVIAVLQTIPERYFPHPEPLAEYIVEYGAFGPKL